ncbi:MAG TPA: hypothetical protein VH744_01425 [Terriglobales bacterium]|jgi:hypothetical protein
MPAPARAQQRRQATRALLPVRGREFDRTGTDWFASQLALHEAEKFSRVELIEGAWHTAPNHSRPQTCITEVDVDAEDYPDRTPQTGQ